MKLAILAALLLAACATKPTYAECAKRAEKEGVYGADVVENILLHDDLIRGCMGMERRP